MQTPETPESIRAQYASPRGESADERRKRLTNRRAAKYRYFKSLDVLQGLRREKNNTRQRDRRRQLDDAAKCRLREQNRVRQQMRRQTLSDAAREEIREKHRMRQQMRRQRLDDQARDALREKERLRVRMRRARKVNANHAHQPEEAQTTAPRPHPLPSSPLRQVRAVRTATSDAEHGYAIRDGAPEPATAFTADPAAATTACTIIQRVSASVAIGVILPVGDVF
ncbi:hypothetical protein FI667_g15874, partial [Globisporangium splendens]